MKENLLLGTLSFPDGRTLRAEYAEGYGVTMNGLLTSNGSPALVAEAVRFHVKKKDCTWKTEEAPSKALAVRNFYEFVRAGTGSTERLGRYWADDDGSILE